MLLYGTSTLATPSERLSPQDEFGAGLLCRAPAELSAAFTDKSCTCKRIRACAGSSASSGLCHLWQHLLHMALSRT